MSEFTPKTRLEKILCGVETTAKRGIEKAAERAMQSAGGSVTPFQVAGTLGTDGDGHNTITLNKTAGELYAAVSAGRAVKFTTVSIVNAGEEDEYTVEITKILHLDVTKMETESSEVYEAVFLTCSDEGFAAYYSGTIAGDTTVVLTEVPQA